MDLWQTLKQIQFKLRASLWDDVPAEKVFASRSVLITSDFDPKLIGELRFPFVVISDGGSSHNQENPELSMRRIRIGLWVRHDGDQFGEFAVMGGQRDTATGSSSNRGLHEVERELFSAVQKLGPEDGIKLQVISQSSAVPESMAPPNARIVKKIYAFEGFLQDKQTYPPVHNLVGNKVVANVVLTWEDPPDRFDRLRISVTRKLGVAPTNPNDGTIIATPAIGAQTLTDVAPAAGAQFYGVWTEYDEDEDGVAERFSDLGRTVEVAV